MSLEGPGPPRGRDEAYYRAAKVAPGRAGNVNIVFALDGVDADTVTASTC